MALVYIDGFNSYSTNSSALFTQNWSVAGALAGYSFTTGRYGGQALAASGYVSNSNLFNASFRYNTPSNLTTLSAGVAIQYTTLAAASNSSPIMAITNGIQGAVSIYIYYNVVGNFYYPVILNASGTILTGKAIANYDPNAWHYYEVEVQAGTTNGFVRFYCDTILIASVANVNTTYNSLVYYTGIMLYSAGYDLVQRGTLFDDFYVNNTTTRSDEMNIITLRPSGDASVSWTPTGGGTHYNQINGTTYSYSPSTTISTATNGVDLFQLGDIPSTGTSVKGKIRAVKQNTLAYKGMFGKPSVYQTMQTNATSVYNQSSSLFEGAVQSTLLPTALYETNPVTLTNWTTADVNNLQTGVVMNNITNLGFSIVNGNILNTTTSTRITSGVNAPTVSGDTIVFSNNNQQIRYTDSPQMRVTAPFSLDMEFYVSSLNNNPMLFNIGQGNGIGWPEFVIQLGTSGQIVLYYSSNNSQAGQTTQVFMPNGTVQLNTWYRIGIMVYNNGALQIRGYFNGAQMFDIPLTQPFDSTNGWAISGDNAGYSTVFLNGGIRNMFVGQSLFWPI